MQRLFAFLVAGFLVAALLGIAADKPPEKLVFETKMGNVTFQHAKHIEREFSFLMCLSHMGCDKAM